VNYDFCVEDSTHKAIFFFPETIDSPLIIPIKYLAVSLSAHVQTLKEILNPVENIAVSIV